MNHDIKRLQPFLFVRAVTLALLVFVLVSAGFAFLSMLHREDELLPGLHLPRVPYINHDDGIMTYRAQIQIDRTGTLHYRGRRLPSEQIRSEVEKDVIRRGSRDVDIQADRDAAMKHVYSAIGSLRGVVPHDVFCFTVQLEEADLLHSLGVWAWVPNGATSYQVIAVADDIISINGQVVSFFELQQHIYRPAASDLNTAIIVHLSPETKVQRLADVLYLTTTALRFQVYLAAQMPELE